MRYAVNVPNFEDYSDVRRGARLSGVFGEWSLAGGREGSPSGCSSPLRRQT